MKKSKLRNSPPRSDSGLLAPVLLLMLLFMVVIIGVIAIDIGHNVAVRSELQNAADAGALAGARDYVDGTHYQLASFDAMKTTQLNTADGVSVAKNTPGTSVKVTALEPETQQNPGMCQVEGQMDIPSFLGQFIGQKTQRVNVRARAQGFPSVTAVPANLLFPLAVSIDTVTGHNKPLYRCQPGDSVTFFLNSKNYTNAAFTGLANSAEPEQINAAIAKQLSMTKSVPGTEAPIEIGKPISLLTNNLHRVTNLADGAVNSALLAKGTVILPLISGDGPYIQSRPVDGFIGVNIKNITEDLNGQIAIEATITKAATKGKPGQIGTPTGISYIDSAIQNLSPGMVALSPDMQISNTNTTPGVIANNFTAAPNASGTSTTQPGQSTNPTSSGTGSISSNFNNQPINGALYLDAIMQVAKNPNTAGVSNIYFTNQMVSFTANGMPYTYRLPNSQVILSNTVSRAITTYNTLTKTWQTTVPAAYTGNIFLGGLPISSASLPAGVQNVQWNGSFSTDTAGLTLNWQWGSAVYNNMTANLNALGVVPTGTLAGTPENFTSMLQQGGTSNGGNNYTGSMSTSSLESPNLIAASSATRTGNQNYPTSGSFNQNYPTSGSYRQNYPTSGSVSQNYPTSGSVSQNYPTSGSVTQNYPTSGSVSQNYPTSGSVSQNYPTSGSVSQNYPTSGSVSQNYPTSGSVTQNYPASGSVTQNYPTSGSYSQDYLQGSSGSALTSNTSTSNISPYNTNNTF